MADPHPFTQSAACCSTPPARVQPYTPKGEFIDIAGTKTYTTFPTTTTEFGLVIIYDIFGYSPQILEGADILASSASSAFSGIDGDSERQYVVFMPDFLDGNPAPAWIYPDDTPEKQEKLRQFVDGPGETRKTVRRLERLQKAMEEKWPEVKHWGLIGYCWGGWVASFATQAGTAFEACAQLHPGFVDRETAEKIVVSTLAIVSKDETEEEYMPFRQGLSGHVTYRLSFYPDMVHGFMSARAQLEDAHVRKNFDDAYAVVRHFFDTELDREESVSGSSGEDDADEEVAET